MNWTELHQSIKSQLRPAPGTWPKNGEFRYFCPFHQDQDHPNLDINEEKGAFICRACGKAGKLTDLAKHVGVRIERRPPGDYKINDENAIWVLKKQGISSETVEHFSIKPNYKKQAWQYPVFHWKTSILLGYRFKAYDATAERKYWESGSIGAVPYFGQVDGPVIYLAEGEKDCWMLSQNNLPAMCASPGLPLASLTTWQRR